MEARQELIEALGDRYRRSERVEKKKILDKFVELAGYHRKHAIRVLRRERGIKFSVPGIATRLYDEAVITALTIIWEAADRICGKRLKAVLATFVESMERNGHLRLDSPVKDRLLQMSAATIDRLLQPVRVLAKQARRKVSVNTPLRKSIAIRTYEGWDNPPPGYFEMDLVAHCGSSVADSHVHSLVLTDIASGWTEAAALIVREQTLITVTLDEIQSRLPFSMLGLDVDNDSAFINEVLLSYSKNHNLELTRSRAYKKNDQAWIEQKNGAIVRKLVGHGRLEGAEATLVLADLHKVARLYVNFFQPSFKLKSKTREAGKVVKKYHAPATPYEQLLADERVDSGVKQRLREQFVSLDPLELLSQIRQAQQEITRLETEPIPSLAQRLWNLINSFAVSKPLGATAKFELHTGNDARTPRLTRGVHVPIRTKRSGPYCSDGCTRSRTQLPKACSGDLIPKCRTASNLGNIELFNAGLKIGEPRSPVVWFLAATTRSIQRQ